MMKYKYAVYSTINIDMCKSYVCAINLVCTYIHAHVPYAHYCVNVQVLVATFCRIHGADDLLHSTPFLAKMCLLELMLLL